jgi:hypothetical protein
LPFEVAEPPLHCCILFRLNCLSSN